MPRKMYLVSHLNNVQTGRHKLGTINRVRRKHKLKPTKLNRGGRKSIHPHDRWFNICKKGSRIAVVAPRKPAAKDIFIWRHPSSDMERGIPDVAADWTQTEQKERGFSPTSSSPQADTSLFETPRRPRIHGDKTDNDDDASDMEEDVRRFSLAQFGEMVSPYLLPYVYNRRFLDKVYGLRRDESNQYIFGDSLVTVNNKSNIHIRGKLYEGTKGLWELLTRKKVNHSLITTDDLKTYKRTLEVTNAHLEDNEPTGNIKTTRGTKFKEVIPELFPQSRRKRGVELALRLTWVTY